MKYRCDVCGKNAVYADPDEERICDKCLKEMAWLRSLSQKGEKTAEKRCPELAVR